MKIGSVTIERYRGIKSLTLPLHPQLTVLHGTNGSGKTSILTAIALALAPGLHGPGRRVELDRCLGLRGDPTITLRDREGHDLSRVEASFVADAVRETGWGHTNENGSFITGEADARMELPPHMLYDVSREVLSSLTERHVGTQVDFDQLFGWFYDRENSELRNQRDRRDFGTTDSELLQVRKAICAMLPGASEPRMAKRGAEPWRFVVTLADGDIERTFSLEQLSGGYQNILAVAADIAWRLVLHQDLPVTRAETLEAVVLLDEVDLHLHPSWQQRVLGDLMRTFPYVQFVVTTHSPQVLTTVAPEHIVELAREDGNIVAHGTDAATYGAEAGEVLSGVMGVDQRPDNPFKQKLSEYRQLVRDGAGESERGLALRKELEHLSPRDFALPKADLEIERRKLFRRMASDP